MSHILSRASLSRSQVLGLSLAWVSIAGVMAGVSVGCASTPVAPTDACARTTLASRAELVCPLLPGMRVPEVEVTPLPPASAGSSPSTSAVKTGLPALLAGPTIVIFYRGGWCPFCNAQLGQLQRLAPELQALGYQIVAVSPDDVDGLRKSVETHALDYQLVSDTGLKAATAFGVAFATDTTMSLALRTMAPQHEGLPVPAVFIVRDGVVRFSYANPDFKVRLAPEILLAAARANVPKPE